MSLLFVGNCNKENSDLKEITIFDLPWSNFVTDYIFMSCDILLFGMFIFVLWGVCDCSWFIIDVAIAFLYFETLLYVSIGPENLYLGKIKLKVSKEIQFSVFQNEYIRATSATEVTIRKAILLPMWNMNVEKNRSLNVQFATKSTPKEEH